MDNLLTNFVNRIAAMTLEAKKEQFIEKDGVPYRLRGDYTRMTNDEPNTVMVNSLSAINEWLESNENDQDEQFICIIDDEKSVSLYRKRDCYENRALIMRATAITSTFPFGCFREQKQFAINVHSSFVKSTEKSELIKQGSRVKAENVVTSEDDGISQNVTMSDGVRVKQEAAKPLFKLAPYRTFSEIDQPLSTYLFRVEKQGGEAHCALFESDDKIWKLEAIKSIRNYLKENVKSDKVSIIG